MINAKEDYVRKNEPPSQANAEGAPSTERKLPVSTGFLRTAPDFRIELLRMETSPTGPDNFTRAAA
jgi:hypothetical protein